MPQRTSKRHQQSREENEAGTETNIRDFTEKDHAKIATLAYSLYEQRGREDGHDLDDWLEAEQRIVNHGYRRTF